MSYGQNRKQNHNPSINTISHIIVYSSRMNDITSYVTNNRHWLLNYEMGEGTMYTACSISPLGQFVKKKCNIPHKLKDYASHDCPKKGAYEVARLFMVLDDRELIVINECHIVQTLTRCSCQTDSILYLQKLYIFL